MQGKRRIDAYFDWVEEKNWRTSFPFGIKVRRNHDKDLSTFFFSSRQEFSLSPRVSFLYALRGSLFFFSFFAFLIHLTSLLAKPWYPTNFFSFLFLYTPLLVKPQYLLKCLLPLLQVVQLDSLEQLKYVYNIVSCKYLVLQIFVTQNIRQILSCRY